MISDDRVGFGQLLRGAIRAVPDALSVSRAGWHLATSGKGRHKSIGLLLERVARAHPERVALRYGDSSWTYAEFNAAANRYAHEFSARGIGRGDAVAIMLENRPEALIAVAATVKLGAVAGMLNTNQRGDVLAHSLGLIAAKCLVVGEECRPAIDELREQLEPELAAAAYWLADATPQAAPADYLDLAKRSAGHAGDNLQSTRRVQLQDPCFYIFTSGTTGLPKASVMTHGRWVKAMAGVGLASLRLRAEDIFYCPLPLYHNNALTLSWGAVLGAGATLALARKFSASRFWDDIRHFDATSFCYIGELCRYLLNQPPGPGDRQHQVRVCMGNGLRPDIWDEFKNRFGIERINEFYGASEGNLVFTNSFGADRTAGFCPLSYAVVAYDNDADAPRRDANGHLCKVARGEVGLLLSEVTDSRPFDGYTDPAASEKKLIRDAFKPGDCWFDTGDLVRDQGFRHIAFVDRVGDTFRWKGENVATTEVESALNQLPQIDQSAVYGVQVPGTDGRAGMAALTLHDALDFLAKPELVGYLRAQLPAYAVPVLLRVKTEHETTSTFKLRKVELKNEGYVTDDPVYVLVAGATSYQTLSAELRAQLDAGTLRL